MSAPHLHFFNLPLRSIFRLFGRCKKFVIMYESWMAVRTKRVDCRGLYPSRVVGFRPLPCSPSVGWLWGKAPIG
jgi:hypothetical protein